MLRVGASCQQLASVPAWWAVSVNLTEEAKLASRHDVSYNGSSPLAKIMYSSATVRSSDIAFPPNGGVLVRRTVCCGSRI